MKKTVLVTGINGFVGPHLANELISQGWDVIGLGRDNLPAENLNGIISDYIACDLANYDQVKKLPLSNIGAIINLASLASVKESFDRPEAYLKINPGIIDNLCKAIIDENQLKIRLLAVSSGAIYKFGQEMPLTEQSEVNPEASPYAKSKIAMEELALSHRDSGVDCIIARPFNHIGPGQNEGFLLPDLYSKLMHASTTGEPFVVGNLTSRRDYTDVRDVAKAYTSLLSQEKLPYTTYNVCSGKSLSGNDILSFLMKALNIQSVTPIVDEKLLRPSDAPDLYGDNNRINAATGWTPSIPIIRTINDFIRSKTEQ